MPILALILDAVPWMALGIGAAFGIEAAGSGIGQGAASLGQGLGSAAGSAGAGIGAGASQATTDVSSALGVAVILGGGALLLLAVNKK